MTFKPRLVPILIAATVVMFVGRIGLLWQDADRALAQSPAQSGAAPPKIGASGAKPEEQPAATNDANASADKSSGSDKSSGGGKPKETAGRFSASEVQLLQELSKRRADLDARSEELDRRDVLVRAAEQRIDEKIARMQDYQKKIETLVNKSHADDDTRLASLVHIYETMKPKEAASIFEGMDMPALLELVSRMSDQKAAPIFAAMSPDRARLVTAALEQRRTLPEMKVN